ncbi:MAG: hypothetical protein J5449_11465, partial [Oscillospiraceae bacterium]|nr:hypothetical protein [Oscillospiraceae bacterium]
GTGATSANPISVTGGTITASGGTVPDATDYSNGSYGVRFTSGNQSTSRFFLSTGGTVIAKGYTFAAWPYGRLAAPKLLSSTSYDGTGKKVSPCDSEYTKYVELDTGSVGIAMTGWNYGDYYADTNGPVYCTALGGITITYKGRAGTNYTESTTLPTNAGNYTATATYKGKTGTADFTISKLSDPATVTNASVNCGDSIDLAEYVSGAKGTVSFSFRGDQHYGCTISGSTFTAGTTAATVLLTVTVANSTNYTGKSLDMSVNVASREAAGVSFTTGDALTKFAGDNPFELLCAVANFGEGTEVWTWQISDENVVTVQDWGNFTEGHKAIATIHGTGTATITVRYHSDTAAGSATLTLTVLDNNAAIPKPTASVNGTTLTWSAAMPESGKSVTAVAAWYDTNGKLLGCKTDTFTASGPVSGKTIDVASGAAKYKLFLLDGNSCPLCEAWDSTKAT